MASYDYLTAHVVPGPQSVSYFLPTLLLISALLIPPTVLSHRQLSLLFLPLIYFCHLHAGLKIGCIDVPTVGHALWSFALLAYWDPRKSFKRIRMGDISGGSPGKAGQTSSQYWEQPYPPALSQRLPWVLTLLLSMRLTNWKIGDPSHDRSQPSVTMTRRAFLKHASLNLFRSYFLLDIACSYVQIDPYFFQPMAVDMALPHHFSVSHPALEWIRVIPPRLIRSATLAAQTYSSINFGFYILTIPAIALNYFGILPDEWSPQNCTTFFGSFSSVTTRGLRGIWGSWWHQMNRHMMSTPGRALNRAFGVPTSSNIGYACLVTMAFFFSGILHMGLIPPQPLRTTVSPNKMRLYLGAFFWVQIAGFAIEHIFEKIHKNLSLPRTVNQILVLSWLVLWLSLSLPLLTPPFREMEYWQWYPLPVSFLQGLFGSRWLMW